MRIERGNRKVWVANWAASCLTVGVPLIILIGGDAAAVGVFVGGVVGIAGYAIRSNVEVHRAQGVGALDEPPPTQ